MVKALHYKPDSHGFDSKWSMRILHWHNHSGCTVALEVNYPLTEMSTRHISWGIKAAGAQGWQPYHLHVPIFMKSGSLTSWNPQDLSRPVLGVSVSYNFKIWHPCCVQIIQKWRQTHIMYFTYFLHFYKKLQFTDPFLCITSSDAYSNYKGPMLSVVIWETEKHISPLPVEHFCPQEIM